MYVHVAVISITCTYLNGTASITLLACIYICIYLCIKQNNKFIDKYQ